MVDFRNYTISVGDEVAYIASDPETTAKKILACSRVGALTKTKVRMANGDLVKPESVIVLPGAKPCMRDGVIFCKSCENCHHSPDSLTGWRCKIHFDENGVEEDVSIMGFCSKVEPRFWPEELNA